MDAANEENVLHKAIRINVNYDPAKLRGFLFQKEYYIHDRTNLLVLVLQHEHYNFPLPEDPLLTYDLHPMAVVDYRVFLWEEFDDNMKELEGFANIFVYTFFTNDLRCKKARANLKTKFQYVNNYTHYQVDLKLLVKEPLGLTNTSNIIF